MQQNVAQVLRAAHHAVRSTGARVTEALLMQPVSIARHRAQEHVRRVIVRASIGAWEQDPIRTKRDWLYVLERAIDLAGEQAPRRGGWQVSYR